MWKFCGSVFKWIYGLIESYYSLLILERWIITIPSMYQFLFLYTHYLIFRPLLSYCYFKALHSIHASCLLWSCTTCNTMSILSICDIYLLYLSLFAINTCYLCDFCIHVLQPNSFEVKFALQWLDCLHQ